MIMFVFIVNCGNRIRVQVEKTARRRNNEQNPTNEEENRERIANVAGKKQGCWVPE
jgi:hypothetical protein